MTTGRRSYPPPLASFQHILHKATGLAEIHLARIFFLEHSHAAAHVAQAIGADLGNRLTTRLMHRLIAKLLGQKIFDDGDFVALLRREFRASAIFERFGGFLALLHHLAQDLQNLLIGHGVFARAAMRNITILNGRLNEPQRARAALVLRLLGGLERLGDLVAHDKNSCHLFQR